MDENKQELTACQLIEQICKDEYESFINEKTIFANFNPLFADIASKFKAYPIYHVTENGEKESAILAFICFDTVQQECLSLHRFTEEKQLANLLKRVEANEATILSEIITGENILNIENDICELEDYEFYYSCLVEDGVIQDSDFNKCKALEQQLLKIENETTLIGKCAEIKKLGLSHFQTVKVLVNSYGNS